MNFFSQYNISQNNFPEMFKNTKVLHVLGQDKIGTESYFRQLSAQCGAPLIYEENPVTGAIEINKWTEIKYESSKSEDSYKSSNKSQPLHTDYGYFSFEIYAAFFYCVEQADFGGATTFVDVKTIVTILQATNSSLFEQIQAQKIHFGRKNNKLAHNDDFILQKDQLGWKINWNYYRALEDKKNKSLVEDFKDFLDHYIEKSGELLELKLQPGEGVFFHDRRVLHGRNSFLGDRHLNKGAIAQHVPIEVSNFLISK